MHDNGYSKNSIAVVKGVLIKSFSFAADEKHIPASPALGLKTPKAEFTSVPTRTAPHAYLSQDKMKRIFERFSCGTSSFIPLLLGYRCGLRMGESFGLLWDDVDFAAKTLSVNRQVQWKQIERTDAQKKQDNRKRSETSGYWYFSLPKYNSVRTIELDNVFLEIL